VDKLILSTNTSSVTSETLCRSVDLIHWTLADYLLRE